MAVGGVGEAGCLCALADAGQLVDAGVRRRVVAVAGGGGPVLDDRAAVGVEVVVPVSGLAAPHSTTQNRSKVGVQDLTPQLSMGPCAVFAGFHRSDGFRNGDRNRRNQHQKLAGDDSVPRGKGEGG